MTDDRGQIVSPGGFVAPDGNAVGSGSAVGGGIIPAALSEAVAELTSRDLGRVARNVAAEAKARAAGETGYLRESARGGIFRYEFPTPPTRRVRARRAIAEAYRRVREAVRVLRTGETSYDEDL